LDVANTHATSLPGAKCPEQGARMSFFFLALVMGSKILIEKLTSRNEIVASEAESSRRRR
jgi:hypothetical protein